MKKKLVSLFLTTAMLFSMAACGSSEASPESASKVVKNEEEASEAENEEVTLSAFVMQSASGESGIWQGWAAKRLYDELKIKIDFEPTGTETETKLQQYLVAGELPDLIGLKGFDQAKLAIDADMLLPLDEYKDKLPNLFESELYENAIKYSQDYNSNGTGHLYIMPVQIGPTAYNNYNWVPLLQWDAYKQVGMPQVTTLEDYLDVVEQMVAYKPTTELGEKVYGFSLFSDWDKASALEVSTLSFMYGIDSEYVSHLMETNVVTKEINSLLDEDSFYKRALKFYFEANQRGLLDPDSMSQTFSDVESKLSAGRVMFSYFSWFTGGYGSDGRENPEETLDGMINVVADDMKLYESPDQTIGRNWYFAISKNCSDVDAALALLNWLYDPEVCRFLEVGPQGVTWDYDENGEPYILNEEIVEKNTEPLMPEEVGGGSLEDGLFMFNTLGPQDSTLLEDGYTVRYWHWPSWISRDPSPLKLEVDEWLGEEELAKYLEPRGMVAKSTQAVNMITPASDDLEITITQIGEVVKKYSWQMVYAKDEAEFESLWGTMVDQAKQLGLDSVTEYYTNEWDKAVKLVEEYE